MNLFGHALLIFVAILSIQPNNGKSIHFWAIRHVESTHNAHSKDTRDGSLGGLIRFVWSSGSTAPKPPPMDEQEKKEIKSTRGKGKYDHWDAPPSRVKGKAELDLIKENFGTAVMASPTLKQELTDARIVSFESSDLVRATITALYARKSLVAAVETAAEANDESGQTAKAIKGKLGLMFTINQYLREVYDGVNADACSRFKNPWRTHYKSLSHPTSPNRKAFTQYLEAAIPPLYKYQDATEADRKLDKPSPIVAGLTKGVQWSYEGSPRKDNPWFKSTGKAQAEKHFKALAAQLKRELLADAGADDVIIAGVHSSWLKEFVEKFGTPEAQDSYDVIVDKIGDEDETKKKLGNGQMIDMEIQLGKPKEGSKKEIKIVSMHGYDIQHYEAGASVGARFESFGDEYYGEYYDDEYYEYYDDDEEEEDEVEDDAYYYDLYRNLFFRFFSYYGW